jgi:probable HAF family extracellular repeat protein
MQSSAVDVDAGQVVGNSQTPDFKGRAFIWTAARGMRDIGTLGGSGAFVTAIDAGQVVGGADVTGNPPRNHAISWTAAGGMVDLGTFPPNPNPDIGRFADSFAEDVAAGQVVGTSTDGSRDSRHAFSWTAAGGMIDLGTLPSANPSIPLQQSRAIAVDAGQVVGTSFNNQSDTTKGFSWTAAGGMVDIGNLGVSNRVFTRVLPADVDAGQVVGTATIPSGDVHAFSWTAAGGMVDLGTLNGGDSEATAVHAGQVVGTSNDTRGGIHAFSWTAAGGMVDLGDLGGGLSQARAVDSGQVVGQATNATHTANNVFSWTAGGGMVDLGTLGGSFADPAAVADGLIVGTSLTASQAQHAFAITGCAPLFLHVSSNSLLLDNVVPTDATVDTRSSGALKFAGGNAWRTIGTWAKPKTGSSETINGPAYMRAWLGLVNSDDQGTRFDIRVELLKNNVPIASGETHCITDLTRNPASAREVRVPVSLSNAVFGASDQLALRVSARIGTNESGALCGGHTNAVGLRLDLDAVNRPTQLLTTLGE